MKEWFLFDQEKQEGPTMGVDGLYELRTRIWRLSENAYRKEAADWMDYAWTIQQIEDTLDWVSWCGDIAFSVASGPIRTFSRKSAVQVRLRYGQPLLLIRLLRTGPWTHNIA